jgi:type II secretory pathway pseudopilin PulG
MTSLKIRILLVVSILAGVAGVIFAVLRSAKQEGRVEEKVKVLEQTLQNVIKKEEVTREVNHLSDGAAADRLRQFWSRD